MMVRVCIEIDMMGMYVCMYSFMSWLFVSLDNPKHQFWTGSGTKLEQEAVSKYLAAKGNEDAATDRR